MMVILLGGVNMAMYNEDMPEEVYLCNACDEIYYDEPLHCDVCDYPFFRVVTKGDLGYLD